MPSIIQPLSQVLCEFIISVVRNVIPNWYFKALFNNIYHFQEPIYSTVAYTSLPLSLFVNLCYYLMEFNSEYILCCTSIPEKYCLYSIIQDTKMIQEIIYCFFITMPYIYVYIYIKVVTFSANLWQFKCYLSNCYSLLSSQNYCFWLTQICSLILFSFLKTVFTLKSIPTVLTNADVKESSAYRNKKEVFPTLLLPIMSSLNM